MKTYGFFQTMTLFFLLSIAEKGLAQTDVLLLQLRAGLATASCECLTKPSATPELRSCGGITRIRFERLPNANGTWAYNSPWGSMATDLSRPIWFYSETKESPNLTIETITSARATKDVLVNRREVIERHPNGLVLKAAKRFELKDAGSRNYQFLYEVVNVREQAGRSATLTTEKVVCKLRPL